MGVFSMSLRHRMILVKSYMLDEGRISESHARQMLQFTTATRVKGERINELYKFGTPLHEPRMSFNLN